MPTELTCSMIVNPGDDGYDVVCGKPARRTILDTNEGCCDFCFEEMIPTCYARGEAELEYPLVSECPACRGRGWHVGDCHPQETCGECDGVGMVVSEPAP